MNTTTTYEIVITAKDGSKAVVPIRSYNEALRQREKLRATPGVTKTRLFRVHRSTVGKYDRA